MFNYELAANIATFPRSCFSTLFRTGWGVQNDWGSGGEMTNDGMTNGGGRRAEERGGEIIKL